MSDVNRRYALGGYRFDIYSLDGVGHGSLLWADVPLVGPTWTLHRRGFHSFSAAVPMRASLLWPSDDDSGRSYIRPWGAWVACWKEGVLVGCFIIHTVELGNPELTIEGVAWLGAWNGSAVLPTWDPLVYDEPVAPWVPAFDLIDQLQTDYHADLGVTCLRGVVPEGWTGGTVGGPPLSVDYTRPDSAEGDDPERPGPFVIAWWETPDAGAVLNGLQDDFGFDLVEQHTYDAGTGTISHAIYAREGRGEGVDRRGDAALRLVPGVNCTLPSWSFGGADTADGLVLVGRGEGRSRFRVIDVLPGRQPGYQRYGVVEEGSVDTNRAAYEVTNDALISGRGPMVPRIGEIEVLDNGLHGNLAPGDLTQYLSPGRSPWTPWMWDESVPVLTGYTDADGRAKTGWLYDVRIETITYEPSTGKMRLGLSPYIPKWGGNG